jgi:hypothetical protein
MSIGLSAELEENADQADRVRRVNQIIEPILRDHSQTARGLWHIRQDERDRLLLILTISDPFGSAPAEAEFAPDELNLPEHLLERFNQLMGQMLRGH